VNARAATIVPTGAGNLEWPGRIETDRRALIERLPSRLVDLHAAVADRAAGAGAAALILSGSTARARRTDISDLDYHVIGGHPIDTSDLSRELDIHVLTPQELMSELMAGDDFVQWSLRFGDSGPTLSESEATQSSHCISHSEWLPRAIKTPHSRRSGPHCPLPRVPISCSGMSSLCPGPSSHPNCTRWDRSTQRLRYLAVSMHSRH
jgi:hypothetical protein